MFDLGKAAYLEMDSTMAKKDIVGLVFETRPLVLFSRISLVDLNETNRKCEIKCFRIIETIYQNESGFML